MKRGRIPSVEEMRRTPEPYTRIDHVRKYISESIGKIVPWNESQDPKNIIPQIGRAHV